MRNVLFAGLCVVASVMFVAAVRGDEPTLAPAPVEQSVLVPEVAPAAPACNSCTTVRERQPRRVRTVTRSHATACGEESTTHTVVRYRLFGRAYRCCN